MSRYPEPRPVEISTADVLGLTVLEWARVSVIAEIPKDRLAALARVAIDQAGTPAEIEAGARVLYAVALMLERRLDPALTWDEAQTWRVIVREAPQAAALAEAEAEAEVAAAMVSGVPIVDRAGELRIAHLAAFGRAHAEAQRAARRRRPRASA